MKIAVISDLHIGDKSSTDMFKHKEKDFINFLDYLEDRFDKVVLLGDIYECLCPKLPFKAEKQLNKVISTYPEISERFFTNRKYIYVPGNHDYIACKVFNLPDSLIINTDGIKIIFKHGHQYDNLIYKAPKTCEFFSCLGGWMLRCRMESLYNIIRNIERDINDAGTGVTQFHLKAVYEAEKMGAQLVVTGHTHMMRKFKYNDVTYANSGTCSNGHISFLKINTEKGSVKVKEWSNQKYY